MIRLANILIVDADHARADALEQRLTRMGYHAAVAETATDGRHAAEIEHPDVVLVGRPADGSAVEFGRDLKAGMATAEIPVVLITDELTPQAFADAFEAGLDDVMEAECSDPELQARLRPLGRLATMHAELHQRAEIAGRAAVEARSRVAAPQGERPKILIVGDRPAPIQAVLADDAEISVVASAYEAENHLTGSHFDAAVVAFSEEPQGLTGFCTQVRNNPRLFNLPIVVLSPGNPESFYRSGATRVMKPSEDPLVLRTAVLTLVRRQQLRWTIRVALNDSLQGECLDAETGAYSRSFLDSFLDARLHTAIERNRHLAVAFFAAPSIAGVKAQFGDDAAQHLLQQLRQWISGLVRAEDLTARFGEYEFCVVLPDTPLAEAEVVMHRIAGVLAYTDFAVREVYQPVKLWVQVGATSAQPGDDLAGVIARARTSIG